LVADVAAAQVISVSLTDLSTSVFASNFLGKSSPPEIGPTGMVYDSSGNLYVADGPNIWKIAPVPEPSAVALFGMAFVALLSSARRHGELRNRVP
jgi:hypothetical protein